MAAGRTKNLIGRRRRVGEDDEDDGALSGHGSQSEGSVISAGHGDNTEGDATAAGAVNGARQGKKHKQSKTNGKVREPASQAAAFKPTADTEAMMQGLTVSDSQEIIDPQDGSTTRHNAQPHGQKHPGQSTFVPNRGNFFMHDTRGHNSNGPLPFRGPAGRGRGRGSQQIGNAAIGPADKSEQAWKHDLHESINESGHRNYDQGGKSSARLFTRPTTETPAAAEPLSFSSTKLLGRVQVRVMLPGMAKPITYGEVPLKQYVRLPDHRPPLRRDKPLRVFLPSIGPRYVFPSTERSFIFIPRTMRPNHRGVGSTSQRTLGGYGYSSRRTSMYGGSVYSGSVAASRRSSIARDREGMFSPGSYAGGFQPPGRPVVRLPRSQHFYESTTPPHVPYSGQHTPTHQIHTFGPPQQPTYQGTPTTNVQHPRPQKTISVSGIESPAALAARATPPQQPFHSQLPIGLAEQAMPYFSPRQQYAYPTGMAQVTSPLSQVPEHSSQPYGQQMFYPQQPYFYNSVPVPMYMMPPPQQGYMYPHGAYDQSVDASQSNMVAHESNGMVFYMPAPEAQQAVQPQASEQYQPADGYMPTFAAPAAGNDYYYNMASSGYYQPVQQN